MNASTFSPGDSFREQTSLVHVAILRIAVGVYFLTLALTGRGAIAAGFELAIGVSLLAGLLTRVGAAAGLIHALVPYLTASSNAVVGLNRTLIALHLAFILASAGRSLGIDAWLHRKSPANPLF